MWSHESVFVDVDGSFTGRAPGTSVVPHNTLLDAMPECREDPRYSIKVMGHGGRVCDNTRFVRVGIGHQKPEAALQYKEMMVGFSNGKTFVQESDTNYLRQKWRQEGEDYLIELKTENSASSSSSSTFLATPVNKIGYFKSARGVLTPKVSMLFVLADGSTKTRTGTVASDLSMIEWDKTSSDASATAFKTWYNCEIKPNECKQEQYSCNSR